LRHGDEGQAVFRFQPFEFDIVKEIAGGTVYFVEQQAIEDASVLLCVIDQLTKRLAFIAFACRLGNAEELGYFPASLRCITSQGIFLYFEAKPFAFLFPTAYPCQGYKTFHDKDPEDNA